MSTNSNIIVSFNTDSVKDEYWLLIEQVGIDDDKITVEDAAQFIDALYELKACGPDADKTGGEEVLIDGEGNKIPPVTVEELLSIASELDLASCKDKNYDVQLEIFKSHRVEPYELRLTNGIINNTSRVEENRTLFVEFRNSKKEKIKYPVIGNLKYKWWGSDLNVTVRIENNYVILSQEVKVGILKLEFDTEYDLVDITVLYNEDEIITGDQYGEDQEDTASDCLALAFYHKSIYEKDIQKPVLNPEDQAELNNLCPTSSFTGLPPDKVSCYELHTLVVKCQCDTDIVFSTKTIEVDVECPRDDLTCPDPYEECRKLMGSKVIITGYTECGETTEDIASPAFYRETCCEDHYFSLPRCSLTTSIFKGGKGIEHGSAFWVSLYGPTTKIVAVPPKDGICGKVKIQQNKIARNCCDEVDNIVINELTSVEVLSPNSKGIIEFTGGRTPYTVSVRGFGFWLNRSYTLRDSIINYSAIYIYTDADACGVAYITISDGCSIVDWQIKSTEGVVVGDCYGVVTNVTGSTPTGYYLPLGDPNLCYFVNSTLPTYGLFGVIQHTALYKYNPTFGIWVLFRTNAATIQTGAYNTMISNLQCQVASSVAELYIPPNNLNSCSGFIPCGWSC